MGRLRLRVYLGAVALVVAIGVSGAAHAQAVVASPPMTGVGVPLPLDPGEARVAFANSCGSILPAASPASTLDFYRQSSWFGACRFGVAHGSGLLKPADGEAMETTYYYGHAIETKYNAPSGNNLVYLTTETAPGNELPNEELFFNSQPLGNLPFTTDATVMFNYTEKGRRIEHTINYYMMDAPCYFGRINLPDGWKLIGDLQQVQRQCKDAAAAGGGFMGSGSGQSVRGFWHKIEVAPASVMTSRQQAASAMKPIQQDYHICSDAPGDCERIFRELVAPLLPHLQEVKVRADAIAADRKAKADQQLADMKAKWQASFAPLEARRTALMQKYAKAGH